MRVLVVGGGGREHALAWKIASSPNVKAVLAAPGSDAIATFATCFPGIKATDADALIQLARDENIGLVVIGPEDPLAAGLADRYPGLRALGVRRPTRIQQVFREALHGAPRDSDCRLP